MTAEQTAPRAGLVADLLRPALLARDAERGWLGALIGRGAWPELRYPLLAAWTAQWSSDAPEHGPALPIVHARPLLAAPASEAQVQRASLRVIAADDARPASPTPRVQAQRLTAPTAARVTAQVTPGPAETSRALPHEAPASPSVQHEPAPPSVQHEAIAPPRPEEHTPVQSRPAERPLPRVVAAFRRELSEKPDVRTPRADAPSLTARRESQRAVTASTPSSPAAAPITSSTATSPITSSTATSPITSSPAPAHTDREVHERAPTRARPLSSDSPTPTLLHPLAAPASEPTPRLTHAGDSAPRSARDPASAPTRDAASPRDAQPASPRDAQPASPRDTTPRPIVAATHAPTLAPPALQHPNPSTAPRESPSPTQRPPAPGRAASPTPRPRVAARPATPPTVHPRLPAPPPARARWEDSAAPSAAARPRAATPALPHPQPPSTRASQAPTNREPAAPTPTSTSTPAPPPVDIDAIVETVERRLARELGRARAMRRLLR